ncbi:hypothetical protein P9112_004441 [Eukaryota sp. TZLM1-RC]
MNVIMSISLKAYNFLQAVGVENWSSYMFKGQTYGHVTSNVAESLNSWMKSLRGLPIVVMLEVYRRKLMDWFIARHEQSQVYLRKNMLIVPAIDIQ